MDTLPEELLLEICVHLQLPPELAALALVSRRFYRIANPILYKRDVASGAPSAPFWAAENNQLGTLQHAREAGADLHECRLFDRPRDAMPANTHYTRQEMLLGPLNNPHTPRSGYLQAVNRVMRDVAQAYLDGYINPKRYQWSPIHAAARRGHVEAVRFLAAMPNGYDDEGLDPIKVMSRGLCQRTVEKCADQSGRFQSCHYSDHTPLDIAQCAGHAGVVMLIRDLTRREGEQRQGKTGEKVLVLALTEDDAERPSPGDTSGEEQREREQEHQPWELFSYRDFVLERF